MWKPIEILFEESDDEGLSYIYFDLGDFHYFTLTFNQNEDDKIYFEFNEQTFSIESNDVVSRQHRFAQEAIYAQTAPYSNSF